MLYIVMLPVKADRKRFVTVISAKNYAEVRDVLNLPTGWDRYVSLGDLELQAVLQSPLHYKSMFLVRAQH